MFDLIRREKRVPFDRFMELALYGAPGGFFQAQHLRSVRSGDFLTSPEVSPLFGETLAELVRREAARIGLSRPVVVDVGAGSGSLLKSLLPALGQEAEPWAVEVSPPARDALARVVGRHRVVSSLDRLPSGIGGVIFANELLDNLPMALARRVKGGWRELWVEEDSGKLGWVEAPVRPGVEEWLKRFAGPVPPEGVVEVQIRACRWVEQALRRLESGALVIFDYGDTAEGLAPRRQEGTLRTYRAHHLGPDPLAEPGETDITADVNFTAIGETARQAGASVHLGRQDELLEELGLRQKIARLRREEARLADSGEDMARMEVRSRRIGAQTLLHPRGLGGFLVLTARKDA